MGDSSPDGAAHRADSFLVRHSTTTEEEIDRLIMDCTRAKTLIHSHDGNAGISHMLAVMAAVGGTMAAKYGGAAGLENFEMNAHASGTAMLILSSAS